MADGDASEGSTPDAGPQASATPELDAAEQGCVAVLQKEMNRVTSRRWRSTYGMDKDTVIQVLRSRANHLRDAFLYLRGLGLECPGHGDFGKGVNGKVACRALEDLGGFFINSPEIIQAGFRIMNASGYSSFFAVDEWSLLESNPERNFRNVLERYFRRICAPGALQRGSPHPRTAPAYGTGY